MARERKAKQRDDNEVEFSRIVAFSDGVFSIAITLLVLGLEIPDTLKHGEVAQALWDQRENLLAYAISFAVIGRFWVVHHGFFSEVKAFDGRLIALNLLYLGWIALIPFTTQVLGEYASTTAAVVVYAANLAGVVSVAQLMSWDARRAGLTRSDAAGAREDLVRSAFIAAVFLLSIGVAFIDPGVAPFIWLLLFVEGRSHAVQRLSRPPSS
ncbi:MAG TPA: TMEM175 family protein [Solirubrobacterales bacterium]|nr:TMEM175 family protein [Solirubrobacterales bacterium]